MVTKAVPPALIQHWTHSHEEDTQSECVYRPASYAFPPSRGRSSFDIKANGTMAGQAPGPVDRAVPSRGRWSYRGDDAALVFYVKGSTEPVKVMHIVSVTEEKLVLKQR